MMTFNTHKHTKPTPPTLKQLLLTFVEISVFSFGGVLPIAFRVLVEKKHWLTAKQFNQVLSLCQLIPGPNIANLAIAIGTRAGGIKGALMALIGLMALPMIIIIALGALYLQYNQLPELRYVFNNLTAVVTGLLAATILKLSWPLLRNYPFSTLTIVSASFAMVTFANISIPLTLIILAPISVLLTWRHNDEAL